MEIADKFIQNSNLEFFRNHEIFSPFSQSIGDNNLRQLEDAYWGSQRKNKMVQNFRRVELEEICG